MAPKDRSTPRERYASAPLTDEEKRELPIKKAQALAMGEPLVVQGAKGDSLVFAVLGASIGDNETIQLSIVFSGTVTRPDRIAKAKGVTQVIDIPAKVEEIT